MSVGISEVVLLCVVLVAALSVVDPITRECTRKILGGLDV